MSAPVYVGIPALCAQKNSLCFTVLPLFLAHRLVQCIYVDLYMGSLICSVKYTRRSWLSHMLNKLKKLGKVNLNKQIPKLVLDTRVVWKTMLSWVCALLHFVIEGLTFYNGQILWYSDVGFAKCHHHIGLSEVNVHTFKLCLNHETSICKGPQCVSPFGDIPECELLWRMCNTAFMDDAAKCDLQKAEKGEWDA